MQLVQVDVVHAEPLQRVVERPAQVAARRTDVVRRVAGREAALGRQYHAVAVGGLRQPAADDVLGGAYRVHVGGVDEVATGLEVPVELLMRAGLVGLVAECHRAQRVAGHDGAAVAQSAVFHDYSSLETLS